MKLRVFSDFHYSYNHQGVDGFEDLRERYYCQFLAEFFNKEADYYISIGDMTNTGRPDEYAGVYRLIDHFGKSDRFRMVLGNHDLYSVDRDVAKTLIRNSLYYAIEAEGVCLLFIDTPINDSEVPALKAINFHYGGEILSEQMNWIRQKFEANRDKPIVLFSHMPIYDTTYLSTRQYAYIRQSQELLEILQEHPQPVIFINGHKHSDSIVQRGHCTFIQMVDVLNHPTIRDINITNCYFEMTTQDLDPAYAQIGRYLGTKMYVYNLNYYGYQGEENRKIRIEF